MSDENKIYISALDESNNELAVVSFLTKYWDERNYTVVSVALRRLFLELFQKRATDKVRDYQVTGPSKDE